MKMGINNSEIEQDAMEVQYGEEILSAGWNPAVEKVCELVLGSPTEATLITSVATTK
ncbi:MAG TPA: hypothetical protein VMJ33_08070 [Gallionella sp.]|nr:hypothetical protein [Gallionella sp.]